MTETENPFGISNFGHCDLEFLVTFASAALQRLMKPPLEAAIVKPWRDADGRGQPKARSLGPEFLLH
jgi:hypothetical protein